MKILVTGGTGYVGRATVELLLSSGHAVKVIGRRSRADVERQLPSGISYRQCDVFDFSSLWPR